MASNSSSNIFLLQIFIVRELIANQVVVNNVTMLQCTMEHNAEVSDDQVIFCARECSNLTKPHQDHQCLSVQVITLTVAKEIRAPLKRKGSNQRQKINV